MKQDILNEEDIITMVDAFYARVRQNKELGPIFQDKIGNNWDVHLEKMYRFWRTLALKEYVYHGNPFGAHVKLPVENRHFDTWLDLFTSTVDELFEGEVAEEVKKRACFMAEMFRTKIDYLRKNPPEAEVKE